MEQVERNKSKSIIIISRYVPDRTHCSGLKSISLIHPIYCKTMMELVAVKIFYIILHGINVFNSVISTHLPPFLSFVSCHFSTYDAVIHYHFRIRNLFSKKFFFILFFHSFYFSAIKKYLPCLSFQCYTAFCR